MKIIYITLIIFALFSCGKELGNSNINKKNSLKDINTIVSPGSEEGGGFGIPKKESGIR